MARSQLMKDAVSGVVPLETILLRLRLILSDLDNTIISTWIQSEIEGYKDLDSVPPYRIISAQVKGTYQMNYAYMIQNGQIPLHALVGIEKAEELKKVYIKDGIGTIQKTLSDKRGNYARAFSPEYCSSISTGSIQIASMQAETSPSQVENLVSTVKLKIVDIIMELEKDFDNLDELDIKSQLDESKIQQAVLQIGEIIYGDSIKIGDNNDITKSDLANQLDKRGK